MVSVNFTAVFRGIASANFLDEEQKYLSALLRGALRPIGAPSGVIYFVKVGGEVGWGGWVFKGLG